MKRNGEITQDAERGLKMYNEIVFALCCFAVGFIAGFASVIAALVTGAKFLSRRKKPKH